MDVVDEAVALDVVLVCGVLDMCGCDVLLDLLIVYVDLLEFDVFCTELHQSRQQHRP